MDEPASVKEIDILANSFDNVYMFATGLSLEVYFWT